ncbi:transposase DNA-binding-containing protein, partial [Pseudoalteromonas sp. TAE79]
MINEHTHWAKQQFGKSDLGDPRRTARLVKLASTLANEPGKPLV